MPIKKTKEDYIEDAKKIHNYKYDYSQVIELPKTTTTTYYFFFLLLLLFLLIPRASTT